MKETIQKTNDQVADDFLKFWEVYPRKVGKQAAMRAWKKVNAPLSILLTAIRDQQQSEQWTKDGGEYIPHPATWLTGQRWEDVLTPASAPQQKYQKPDGYNHPKEYRGADYEPASDTTARASLEKLNDILGHRK